MTLLLVLAACTFAPGHGFGALDEATLDAAWVPGEGRDLGGDTVLTDLGYEVHLDTFTLGLVDARLLELSGGGPSTFDPANPPEGYGLCHGGHCHRDDGALIAYADIEAELAGSDASFVAVTTLPIDAEVDLLAGASLDLSPPDADLPGADVSKIEVGLTGFTLVGTVADRDGWAAPFTVTLPTDAALSAGLELPLDRAHPPAISLALAIEPGGTLFDGLDFALLADEDGVVLDDIADPGASSLLAALLAVEPTSLVTRSPW
ncbi:MAG: hypothetical protein V4850_01580 [Myxococcota bacterium]